MGRPAKHHILYEPDEWTVELGNQFFHKICTIVQRMKPTQRNYVVVTNLIHALTHEWSRIRKELDQADAVSESN